MSAGGGGGQKCEDIILIEILKRAKEKHFYDFFNENIKDVKKTWINII